MNSLLGNLHMMRRRERSGTGQGAHPLGQERPGTPSIQQPQHHSSLSG